MTIPLSQILRLSRVEHRGGIEALTGERYGGVVVARFSDGRDSVFETVLPAGFSDPLVANLGPNGARYKVTIERLEEGR